MINEAGNSSEKMQGDKIETILSRRQTAYERLSKIESLLNQRDGVSMVGNGEEKDKKMSELLLEAHREINSLEKDWVSLVQEGDEEIVTQEIAKEGEVKKGWKTHVELNQLFAKIKDKVHNIYSGHEEKISNYQEIKKQEIEIMKENIKVMILLGLDIKGVDTSKIAVKANQKMSEYKKALHDNIDKNELSRLRQEAFNENEKAIDELKKQLRDFKGNLKGELSRIAEEKKAFLEQEFIGLDLQEKEVEQIVDEIKNELLREFNIN